MVPVRCCLDSDALPRMMEPPLLEELVEVYYRDLYRFAISLTKNEPDAVDLTQQTFYRFALKGDQLRDPSKAKSWLFTTMKREFFNDERKARNFRKIEQELTHQATTGKSQGDVVDKMDSGLAMDALQKVDDKFRLPLALFYLQGCSYKQIAKMLELPIGTVMSRLSRGKRELKHILTSVPQVVV